MNTCKSHYIVDDVIVHQYNRLHSRISNVARLSFGKCAISAFGSETIRPRSIHHSPRTMTNVILMVLILA